MPVLIDFPDLPYEEFDIQPIDTRFTSPMEDRANETARFGTPFWRLFRAMTGKLTYGETDTADAFFQSASKGGTWFLCHDVYRPRPRAYGATPLSGTKAGGGAFDGTAVLAAVTNSQTINVSGLPAGFMINKSALVEIRKSDFVRSLHRVMVAATANGAGTVTLSIEFPLATGVFTTGNSIVNFERPSCLMQLGTDFSLPKSQSNRRASFTAMEGFPIA